MKNNPDSRKKSTFDIRERDVLLFEIIEDKFILAKIKGETKDGKNSYWTLMDLDGTIHKIDDKLNEIVNDPDKDWIAIY